MPPTPFVPVCNPTSKQLSGKCGCGSGIKGKKCHYAPDRLNAIEAERKEAEAEKKRINDSKLLFNRGVMCERTGNDGAPPDYKGARASYTQAAELGLAMAQDNLGCLLRDGKGGTRDLEKAFGWFTKGAEQGYALAQHNAGVISRDRGDYKNAFAMFTSAAASKDPPCEQGHSGSQNALGGLWHEGWGTDKSEKKAVEWYRKSAAQGDVMGMNALACMLMNGWGCDKNITVAKALLEKAAAGGDPGAQGNLTRLALIAARAGNDEIAKGKAEKAAAEAAKMELKSGTLLRPAKDAADFEAMKLGRKCDTCGKTERQCQAADDKLRYCGYCKLAKYCSHDCQTAAWPTHEAACVAVCKERKGKAAK